METLSIVVHLADKSVVVTPDKVAAIRSTVETETFLTPPEIRIEGEGCIVVGTRQPHLTIDVASQVGEIVARQCNSEIQRVRIA